MTDWDTKLISKAKKVKYKNYKLVFELMELADTSEGEKTLHDIGEMLFELHINKGRVD